ncbi:hypothetical protein HGB47_15355 [Leptospira yasudae]|uniref:hypothetical protein n=1 Tax=Leptospira yasudae TaxID=2202201 RepID=UPI001C50051C|nr:hypothetical protein [Leptospira yasudae]MBW0434993.1 hypothetical protein [Leptospira yasudae]
MNKKRIIISTIQLIILYLLYVHGKGFYINWKYSKIADGYFNTLSVLENNKYDRDVDLIKSLNESTGLKNLSIYITDSKRKLELIQQGEAFLNKEDIEKNLVSGEELLSSSRVGIIFLEKDTEEFYIISILRAGVVHVVAVLPAEDLEDLIIYYFAYFSFLGLVLVVNYFLWKKDKVAK